MGALVGCCIFGLFFIITGFLFLKLKKRESRFLNSLRVGCS